MHYIQEPASRIEADGGVPRLGISPGVHQAEEGVGEDRRGLLEAYPMLVPVLGRLGRVPHERLAIVFVVDVHDWAV